MSKKNNSRVMRECHATWDYNEGEELKSVEVQVRYYSPTIADLKAERAKNQERLAKKEGSITWLSDELHAQLHSIDGLPQSPTVVVGPSVAWLDDQDLPNLRRIAKAIEEDISPGK